MIFWLLLMTGSSPEVIGKEEIIARLNSYSIVDVCGNKKEVVILVDIGPVSFSDSLIGFDFKVSFDSTKIKFSTIPITISTMAVFFGQKKISPSPTNKSILTGYGVNFSFRPVAGNGKLIGFYGYYIGSECPDTNIIKFVDINFNEEFKKEVVGYENGEVITYIKDDDDRRLDVNILNDTLKFDDTTTIELAAEITSSDIEKLEFAEFEIEIADANNYDISEIKPLSGNIEIVEFSKKNGKYYFKVDFTGDISGNEQIALIINEVKKDSLVTSLKINPIKVNECACITNLKGDISFLESFKAADTIVAVIDDRIGIDEIGAGRISANEITAYYDGYNDKIVVKSKSDWIYKVDVYDLQGRMSVSYTEENLSNHVEYEGARFGKGVYILIVTQTNKKKYKIVLVIN